MQDDQITRGGGGRPDIYLLVTAVRDMERNPQKTASEKGASYYVMNHFTMI